MNIEFTDRYIATGTPYPDEGSCPECEGMGNYPVENSKANAEACKSRTGKLVIIGQKEDDGSPCDDDGWLFVQCPLCEGTRRKATQ